MNMRKISSNCMGEGRVEISIVEKPAVRAVTDWKKDIKVLSLKE